MKYLVTVRGTQADYEAQSGRATDGVPAWTEDDARSKLLASRNDSAVAASTSSARSASTWVISGWSTRCFWNTVRCRQ